MYGRWHVSSRHTHDMKLFDSCELVGCVMRKIRLEKGYLCVGQVNLNVGRYDEC